jgi:L-asparagine transporter-like permease
MDPSACKRRRLQDDSSDRKTNLTITLTHFSAAAVFAFFASIVFGITHRDTTREMIRYGLYCFAMFLGGVIVAGWAMWLIRR